MASAFASMPRRALRYLKPPRTDGARNGGVVSSIHAQANCARSASGMGFHANVSSLAGQVGLGEPFDDAGVGSVKRPLEQSGGGVMTGQYDGQGGAQQAIIGSREVEGCSETGVGDAIAVTAGDALDRAVEA